MPKRKKEINESKKEAFLIAFKITPHIGHACEASGNSRSFIDTQIKSDPELEIKCAAVLETSLDDLRI